MQILSACAGIFGANTVIPNEIPFLVTTVINIIKIAVPILLIIFGMLDLGKAVTAQKEDEIKKGQQTFMKRAIAAIIVFLVVAIVQLVIGLLSSANSDNANIWTCVNEFINYQAK
jgi:surface polysaccharide O-acyltransferase-like enzyme